MPERFNIAQYLPAMAQAAPQRAAVVCAHAPDGQGRTELSFAELDAESGRLARGLEAAGVRAGWRTLLMVRPGLDFVALTFAAFKLGAVPVLIDPGMGKRNLLDCVRQARPEAFIAVPLAHALRIFLAEEAFDGVQVNVTVGRRWFWGGLTLSHLRRMGESSRPFPMAETTRESPAAILFTTGSTGTPKGVLYRHGMFDAQVAAIRAQYGIEPGETDLPAFPLFALFSTALGTTCVIPEMDPTRPARCDPEKIVAALQRHEATYTFGSPAIWKRVGPYCAARGIRLPRLKRILMAGAPVRGDVLAPFADVLGPGGDTHIPYGATEALPVSSIRGSEVLRETWALTQLGKGHCVGRPLPGVTVRIAAGLDSGASQDGVNVWDDARVLPQGEIGEIVVKGAAVTREYYELPEQTRAAKIYEFDAAPRDPEAAVAVWHRMGDMGYFDAEGRLWFCGRKAHRVELPGGPVLYSVCVEAVFEAYIKRRLRESGVAEAELASVRVALAGIGPAGSRRAAIVLEDSPPLRRFRQDEAFASWRREDGLARHVSAVLLYGGGFPVDIRHNAKIDREQIARWAATQ